jgi:hypothetical protein
MRLPIYAASLSLLASAAFAADNRPAAPQVTVGADLRELIFDWDPVPGAAHYELLANPDGHSGFTSVSGQIPASRTRAGVSVSVHLQHWSSALYMVAACNAAGCRNSAPVSASDQMLDAIGYLKASNTNADDGFGSGVVLSDDGYTLAVAALREDSNASGVNGNQADNSSTDSGAVYIFRREGRRWRQEAYIKARLNQPGQSLGSGNPFGQQALAINGRGSILAVGAPDETVNGAIRAGKVYFYGRGGDGRWTAQSTLRAPTLQANDYFGASVDLSVDGRTLKVNSIQPHDWEGNPEVRTHIFVRSGPAWVHSTTIAPPVPGEFCQTVRMSGDGHTLIMSCWGYIGTPVRLVTMKRSGDAWHPTTDLILAEWRTVQPLAVNFNGSRLAFQDSVGLSKTVRTYGWNGTAWVLDGSITRPVPVVSINTFANHLIFNRSGNMLVVGDILSGVAGAGVSETASAGTEDHGAVFVYLRNGTGATPWALKSVVKAPIASIENRVGHVVALSGSGLTLAVGAPYEDSAATGVDGDRTDTSRPEAGAVFLY